jgi:hypothetical protein
MSELVPQTVQVLLGERNRKVSDKLATPGTLTRAENVEMTTTGRYQRRPGTFSDGQPSSSAKELAAYGDELVALADTQMYSRIQSAWTTRSSTALNRHMTQALEGAVTGTDQCKHDFARGGNYDWHVWEDRARGGIRYSVKDTATGAYVVFDKQVSTTGTNPAIVSNGAQTLILYMDTGFVFRSARMTHAAPSVIASDVMIDVAKFGSFDWHVSSVSTVLVLAYKFDVGGQSRMRVREWNPVTNATGGVVTSGAATNGDAAIGFLDHNLSNATYYISALNATAWSHITVPTNLASVTETVLESGAAYPGIIAGKATTGWVDGSLTAHMYADSESGLLTQSSRYRTRTSGGVVSLVCDLYFCRLASKAWRVPSTGERFVLVGFQGPPFVGGQGTILALPGAWLAAPTARILAGTAPYAASDSGDGGVHGSRLPTPVLTGDTASIAVMKASSGTNAPPGKPFLDAYRADLTPWAAGVARPFESDDALVVPGGFPRIYDGNQIVESGFHVHAQPQTSNTVAGTLAAGTYFWTTVYSWKDAKGREHQSSPAPEFSHVLGAPGGIQFLVASCQLTARVGTPVVAKIYRSKVNAGAGAPKYFRGYAAGFISAQTWAFTDNDINRLDGEELYTKNDVILDNGPPPPMRQMWTWGGRQWGLLEENRKGAAWSKLAKEEIGAEWNEEGQFPIDDEFGDLTAGIGMGERNLFFKRDAIYWIAGAGPDDAGNGTFSDPQRLDGAPGTENPRSLLATDIGVFYQAPDKVIWLLELSLERKPLGDPCVDITDTITSATLVPDRREARFTTSAGTTLKYDLTHRRWMTNTGQAALASCTFGGVWHYLTTAGFVRHEDRTLWTEAGSGYQAVLELTWLSLGQLAGYMRTWLIHVLGELRDAHDLSAALTADYGTSTVTRAVSSASLGAAHGYRVEIRVPLSMQQNTALKLRLSDNFPVTAGFGIDALLLQCGFLPGKLPKLPATHRMG